MSQRERWIVYPLLFLAVTLAGFNKIFVSGKTNFEEIVCKRLKAQEITCAEMQTVSIDGKRKLVRVGSTPEGGGELLVYYQEEHPQPEVVLRASAAGGGLHAAAIECSRVIVTDDGQRSLVEIGSNEQGGLVNARSRDGAWGVALAHAPVYSGLFGVDSQGHLAHRSRDTDEGFWGLYFRRPVQYVQRSMPQFPGKPPESTEEAMPNEPTPNATESAPEAPQGEAAALDDGPASSEEPRDQPASELDDRELEDSETQTDEQQESAPETPQPSPADLETEASASEADANTN